MAALSDGFSMQTTSHYSSSFTLATSVELSRHLMELGALAGHCGGHLQTTGLSDSGDRRTLIPTAEMLRRLRGAKEAANLLDHPLSVVACTKARTALGVEDDADACDRRFMTGMRRLDQSHVYCGGVDGAVARALVFAPDAAAVCYESQTADLAEAAQFASKVRSSFPGKRIGFGYAPKPEATRWNELDHRAFESKLRRIGYDFYFVSHFGQCTFPSAPAASPWVLMDDAALSTTIHDRLSPYTEHRVRNFRGASHAIVSRATFEIRPGL